MNSADPRIPKGYPKIFLDFLALKRLHNWQLEADGSIPVVTLIAYIELQFVRVMAGDIKMNTLHYYLSALKSIHDANGINWKAREDRRVSFILKRLLRTPGLPSQEGTQDHAVSIFELTEFCKSLNVNNLSDIVAGAVATSLFHGLGRTPELLHAPHHPPMKSSALNKIPSPVGQDTAYSIRLSFPKIVTLKTQYISPLITYGITSANFWIERLQHVSSYSTLWQIDSNGTVPDSSWLFQRLKPFVQTSRGQTLGPCSLRAGGTSYLAARGYDLSHIQLLGRWETLQAFNRYLRDHPFILQQAFQSRIKGKHE
jgi:hypothetical protein